MLDLYYLPASAPCRAVILAARILDVPINLKTLNIMAGEHLTPEFLKLNPQHCIPTLDDEGFVLWESRAIMTYLADQYSKDETMYPRNPRKRAMVDQRMQFDLGTLYARILNYFIPVLFQGEEPDEKKLDKVDEALDFLNTFLEGQEWVAGDNMTIADVTMVASVATIDAFKVIELSNYPNVSQWYARCKVNMIGYEDINQNGADQMGEMWRSKTTSNDDD